MKTIKLKKLILNNFQGVKKLDIDLENTVYISGPNASGKTTIFDSFTWLLFDKNSNNQTKFEIKPLDKNNKPIRVDVEVEGVFEIDGKKLVLKKQYKEKWTKRRGDTEETFTGNETIYEVDGVPVKKNDYKKIIEEKFTDEDLFKLLTNPLFFSNNLKWQDARELILKISGDITDEEVIENRSELEELKEDLQDKSIDDLLKSAKASSKKLVKEKADIPVKIDELQKSIVEIDEKSINEEIKNKEDEITKLEESLKGFKSNSGEIFELKESAYHLKEKLKNIDIKANEKKSEDESAIKLKIRDWKNIESENRMQMNDLDHKIKFLQKEIEHISNKKDLLGNRWLELFNSKFDRDEVTTCCPTCKREFDTEDIESKRKELESNFNQNKADELEFIKNEGSQCNNDLESKNLEIDKLKKEKTEKFKTVNDAYLKVQKLEEELKNIQSKDYYTDEMKQEQRVIKERIHEIEEKIKELQNDENTEDKSEIEVKIKELKVDIKKFTEDLGMNKVNEKTVARVTDLELEEKQIASKIAAIEKRIMLCEKFIITKVELLEQNINKKFNGVKFKLFEQQVNGGINETCEALIDGVPFNNANTASKINAGLSIIKTIGDFYEVKMPIFIDNRESVILLEEVDTQVINLMVDNIDELQISGGKFND
ncbi:AAA family ATPase [Peptostreptococcus faecalis]|uniref:AAA family ATPase n=1 Tax=Peptostreptococcus faecalis TaxID=2045015 RepID=UPI000C7AB3D4|nr:AAA family ATPase [Peptostreptococcus faecalis]